MIKLNEQQFLEMPDRERDDWITHQLMDGEYDWKQSGEYAGVPYAYSTDYNAMMRVVEKMRDDGWAILIDSDAPDWDVWFVFPDPHKMKVGANKSLPLAVYLAAGRAKGLIDD